MTSATLGASPREADVAVPVPHGSRFRPDIEGLRALAVGLVLFHHAELRWVSGGFIGVDVFFVISGFLITGLLVREVERTGRIALSSFYARRIRRLLPAAALVLVAATVLTWWLLPITQRRVFGGDIVSAAFYVLNWRLANRSVDYLAEGVDPSPVQHYWSLAVEEQFYIIWPLLMVFALVLVRRLRLPLRPTLGVGIALVIVPSLVWSIYATSSSPASAFFLTTTRLWELGIGAAVAVSTPLWTRLNHKVAAVLALVGFATIVGSALAITPSDAWPGSLALAPVLGTAAVIAAGVATTRTLVARGLGLRAMVWVGGLSYSIYLWHWLFIVGGGAYFGTLGARRGVLLTLASLVPAWLCHRLIENPVRFAPSLARSPRLALSVGANLSLVAAIAGLTLVIPETVPAASPGSQSPKGVQAILDDPNGGKDFWSVDTAESIQPDPNVATEDLPEPYGSDCVVNLEGAELRVCEYAALNSDTTVALAGDSKALQWFSALEQISVENGWRLILLNKSACALSDALLKKDDGPNESCAAWNEQAQRYLAENPPDLLLTSSRASKAYEAGTEKVSSEGLADGLTAAWQELQRAGIPVINILDNPAPADEVYECVAKNRDALSSCSFEGATASAAVQRAAADRLGNVGLVDLSPYLCPGGHCPAVIGDMLVYRQGSHITDTYARSLQHVIAHSIGSAAEQTTPTVDPDIVEALTAGT